MADDDKADVFLYKKAPTSADVAAYQGGVASSGSNDVESATGRHDHNDVRDYMMRQEMCCGDKCTKRGGWLAVLAVALAVTVIALAIALGRQQGSSSVSSSTPSADAIAECLANGRKYTPFKTQYDTPSSTPVLIQNANVYDGNGGLHSGVDILVEQGKITQFGASITPPAGAKVINAEGRYVTPGLVDMHSHIGVYSYPEDVPMLADGNEMTNPIFPQVRAIDALNPNDRAIPWIRTGGVTTSQILPGSGNVMGGEGIMVKMKTSGISTTVQDLLLPNSPRFLKFASGENPKRVYGSKGETPASRMGSAYLMREVLLRAKQLINKQIAFCSRANTGAADDVFPDDLSLNPLVGLLTGSTRVHIHSYMVHDMEMLLRLSKEFNFKIAAFHHGIEAYKIPELLLAANVTVATWADSWGFKWEAQDQSVYGHKKLVAAGVPVALHSDHPAVGSSGRFLMYEAAKSHHWGLPTQAAISSVTSVPARAMGVSERVGMISKGYDGDVVVWDRHPLLLGARPNTVVIDGSVMVENSYPAVAGNPDVTLPTLVETGSTPVCSATSPSSLTCYAVLNVTIYPMTPTIDTKIENGAIVVRAGKITCMGSLSDCQTLLVADCQQYSLSGAGGVVIPGLIESGGQIGTVEAGINLAGAATAAGLDGSTSVYNMIDDVQIQAKHVRLAWAEGVSTAIVAPNNYNLVRGRGVSFYTCCGNVVDDNLLSSTVGVHVTVGGVTGSNSADLAYLRQILQSARDANDTGHTSPTDSLRPFMDVIARRVPLIVTALYADHISAVLRLQAEYGFKLVITQGLESWLLASRLSAVGAAVQMQMRVGPRLLDNRFRDDSIYTLTKAGVKVAITLDNVDARLLRWEAGWAREYGLTTTEALATVTVNPADMFGLPSSAGRIIVGQNADFFLYNGDPLSLQSYVMLGARGAQVQCNPLQP